ncbi:MAG: anhydro-N-acetylmuramic acid kinase [Mariprofundaceae bacterium]
MPDPNDAPALLVGLMSGTSCDGIDTAILRLPRRGRPELLHFASHPMPDRLREPLLRLAAPGVDEIDAMGEAHMALGAAFADAALAAIEAAGLATRDITAIGCHGQTIRHRPRARHPFSLQIGSPAMLAERTGITVVADFRARDIAAGGQGAPLMPLAHRAFFARKGEHIAALNIGGIANITWLGADGATIGFDTGPGNMVMDALMLTLSDGRERFDAGGELAARGRVDEALLGKLMAHPFFRRRPPKSTGREAFGADFARRILAAPDLTDADRLATALELTARTIADAARFLPAHPDRWIVCGGGSRNTRLMQRLAELLAPAPVATADDAGMPAQAVEAAGFALFAALALRGEANALASVTGATHDSCGGSITPGANWAKALAFAHAHTDPAWIR